MYTLDELRRRHSVRKYGAEKLSAPSVDMLKSEATYINTHEAGIRFELITDDGAPFEGFRRSYGMLSGVNNYFVAIVDPSFDNVYEKAGYYGEYLVMKAVEAGLGTCFVSGTFSESDISVYKEVYEKVAFLITLGYEDGNGTLVSRISTKIMHRKEKSAREFFVGSDKDYSKAQEIAHNLSDGLEAISCAPSAMNKKQTRVHLLQKDKEQYIASFTDEDSIANQIDLGIAKFNFASVVGGEWEWGQNGVFYKD
jgi:hypothetical protein